MSASTSGKQSGGGLRFVMRAAGALHRGLYRLSGGRVGRAMGGMEVLLLTTVGRKSGQPRTWPLTYVRDGDNVVIIASAGGLPQHPAWYLNLRDNPRVTVHFGQERREMIATTATGAERDRLWTWISRDFPQYASYQRKTTRQIPVVVLSPAA